MYLKLVKTVLFVLFFPFFLFSQAKEQIYLVCDKMPEYPGGMKEMKRFINNNLRIPNSVFLNKSSCRGIAFFVIDSLGNVVKSSTETIHHTMDDSCQLEAIRIINSMPRWSPCYMDDIKRKVNVKLTVPILFSYDSIPKMELVRRSVLYSDFYFAKNDYKESLKFIESAINLDYSNGFLHFKKSKIYFAKNKTKKGCQEYNLAIKYDASLKSQEMELVCK